MKHWFLFPLLLLSLLLTSCHKDDEPQTTPYKRTVLVYIVADNNLLSGFAEKDLAEMKEGMADIAGLSKTQPLLAAAFAVFMFSLAGIPPLFCFWSKFVVFDAAVQAGLYPLAAIGVALSAIGAYYYLKIIKTMYFDEPAGSFPPVTSPIEGGLIAASAVFLFPVGWFLIVPLGAWSLTAARSLF